MNRLTAMTETGGLSQGYSYDQYGNRAVTSGFVASTLLTPQNLAAFDVNNNQVRASTYDAAGNQARDGAGRTFTYDAENHQSSFNGSAATYSYDGEGKRVKKIDESGTTHYVYDALGQMVAEYSNAAQASGDTDQTSYVTSDTLGTPRVITGSSGQVKARHDYLPFGEELQTNTGSGAVMRLEGQGYVYGLGNGKDKLNQKFTGKERDGESGLDYFETRYYSSTQGSFTGTDSYNIILEKEKGRDGNERHRILLNYISQPQIWNKYAYTINNPLKHTDPDGRRPITEADFQRLKKLMDAARQIAREDGNYELIAAIDEAAKAILNAIAAVPEGQADPANLKAVFWAIDNLGNTDYGLKGTVSNGYTVAVGKDDNKCNIFVANAYAIGAGIGFDGDKGVPTTSSWYTFGTRKWPQSANDLANRSNDISRFPVVSSPEVGSIAAFPSVGLGHSTIHIGGGAAIYASNEKVKVETIRYVKETDNHPSVTYRSYKP